MSDGRQAGLRSNRWFVRDDDMGLRHRALFSVLGYEADELAQKPIIGICNPTSEFNPCEIGFRELVGVIKRGVTEAGGIPLEFPTMALGADLLKPADMLYRNLVSMDIEESIRGYPIDGVVLLTNCDKTTPAQLMAAASANLPAIQFSAGPKAVGYFRNEPISSGTDLWRYYDEYRTGQIDREAWKRFEACLFCSSGACNEMGTTSSMTAISEALGMMPLGTSSIPAGDSRRVQAAAMVGRRIVAMVREDLRPDALMTAAAFDNAIKLLAAIGGSTNAIVHLIAIAGRRGLRLPLARFDELSAHVPLIANIKPSGQYLLGDYDRAGGTPAVLKEIAHLLDLDARNCLGVTLRQGLKAAHNFDPDVIRPVDQALGQGGALVTLHGNLAPLGAVMKVSAASSHLLEHTGPALVFEDYEEMLARIDDPELPVTAESVLVMRQAGPKGVPGMPEWGQIPIPMRLLRAGVRDLLRISDARMSGTSYGAVVLHTAPESAVGGPLALVRDGDPIRLSVAARRLDLLVAEDELAQRRAAWQPRPTQHLRGYPRLYIEHVLQADEGCDFDFLRPESAEQMVFVEPQVGRS
jgi:dihydroxy-acid dehydratase